MPKVAIHLSFNGDCAEAFAHYARVTGGSMGFKMTYAESPMAGTVPEGERGRVMHASLMIPVNGGNFRLMGADAVTGHPYSAGNGYAVSLDYPSVEEAERAFNALAEGGFTIMPFAPTFWAKGFGMTKDRFGITWMVGSEQAPA